MLIRQRQAMPTKAGQKAGHPVGRSVGVSLGRAGKASQRKEHLNTGNLKLKAGSLAGVGWREHCWSDTHRCESEFYPGFLSLPRLEPLPGCVMVHFVYQLD